MWFVLLACTDPAADPSSPDSAPTGDTATAAVACDASSDFEDPGDADWILELGDEIPALALDLPPENRALLEALDDGADSLIVCGTLETPYGALGNVGVRMVGKKFNSFQPYSAKPYLELRFDEYEEGRTMSGLSRVRLYNQWEDMSGYQRYLGYTLWRDAGYAAPRSGFATLTLDGRDVGLYQASETLSAALIERWTEAGFFAHAGGNIYEGEYGNDLTNDPAVGSLPPLDIAGVQDEVEGGDAPLAGLAEVVDDSADIEVELLPYMDPERWHTHWALEMAVGALEGYTEIQNNWYLYQDPGPDAVDTGDDRFTMLPWGFDQVLHDLAVLPGSPQAHLPRRGKDQAAFLAGQCAALRAVVGTEDDGGTVDWEALRETADRLDAALDPDDAIDGIDRWKPVEIRSMRDKVDYFLERRPLDLRAWMSTDCP